MNKLITLFHRFKVTKVTMMILIKILILSCLLIKQNHFPSSTSSSTSSSSSASSINDSNSSNSDTEDENVDLSQNPAMSGVNEQEEKKGKKRVRKPSM